MTKMTAVITFLLVSVLTNSIAIRAQQPSAPIVRTWEGIKALPPKDDLVVKLRDGSSVKGNLNNATDMALTLSHRKKTREINRESIFQIYRSVPKSRKKAMWIGAGVMTGLGLLSVAMGDGGSDGINPGVAAVLVVLNAGLGALIGRGVASGHERVLIYEARR